MLKPPCSSIKARPKLRFVPRAIIYLIAALYLYGAIVHGLNIGSMNGFDWSRAPLTWKALDLIYLIIDIVVVIGIVAVHRFGFIAFFFAAFSQLALYTFFRSWILDAPSEVLANAPKAEDLDALVVFHCVTVLLALLALYLMRRGEGRSGF